MQSVSDASPNIGTLWTYLGASKRGPILQLARENTGLCSNTISQDYDNSTTPAEIHTFPASNSIIFPTVIREGNPCGFMIVSGPITRESIIGTSGAPPTQYVPGTMPWSLKGMSS